MTIPNLKIVESPVEDLVLKLVEQPRNDVTKQQCQGVMLGVHIPYFTLLVIIIKFWNIISLYHPRHTCITLDYVSSNTSNTGFRGSDYFSVSPWQPCDYDFIIPKKSQAPAIFMETGMKPDLRYVNPFVKI